MGKDVPKIPKAFGTKCWKEKFDLFGEVLQQVDPGQVLVEAAAEAGRLAQQGDSEAETSPCATGPRGRTAAGERPGFDKPDRWGTKHRTELWYLKPGQKLLILAMWIRQKNWVYSCHWQKNTQPKSRKNAVVLRSGVGFTPHLPHISIFFQIFGETSQKNKKKQGTN